MITHRELHVRTTVLAPTGSGWAPYCGLPVTFGDDHVCCGPSLRMLVRSHAGIASRLVRGVHAFRLLARDGRDELRAFVEWTHDPITGWEAVSDPWTLCVGHSADADGPGPLCGQFDVAA